MTMELADPVGFEPTTYGLGVSTCLIGLIGLRGLARAGLQAAGSAKASLRRPGKS